MEPTESTEPQTLFRQRKNKCVFTIVLLMIATMALMVTPAQSQIRYQMGTQTICDPLTNNCWEVPQFQQYRPLTMDSTLSPPRQIIGF